MIFHGWLQLEVEEIESETSDEELRRQDEAILTVKRRIDSESDSISQIEVGRGGNHMVVLTAHGILNHRHEKVIEMFRWVAASYPESFGLLHVWDDQHPDYNNCFRVYRCANGKCMEMDDPHLSPCIPTIEALYQTEEEQDGETNS